MGKQKRRVLFIRIEVYCLVLPNESQTEIAISIYKTKNSKCFPILKCNIRFMNCLGIPTIFEKFFSVRENVVLVPFFQNKFDNPVFIFRFFMNVRR